MTDWDTPFDSTPVPISANRKITITKGIEESIHHLDRDNPAFFADLLPSNQCWRLFPEFRESTVYLDIETTGLEDDDGSWYGHGTNVYSLADDWQLMMVWQHYDGSSNSFFGEDPSDMLSASIRWSF